MAYTEGYHSLPVQAIVPFPFLSGNFIRVTFQDFFPCVAHVCQHAESCYSVHVWYSCPKKITNKNLNYIPKGQVENISYKNSALKFSFLPELKSVSIYIAWHMQNEKVYNCSVIVFLRRESLHLTYSFPRMNPERFLSRYCSDGREDKMKEEWRELLSAGASFGGRRGRQTHQRWLLYSDGE